MVAEGGGIRSAGAVVLGVSARGDVEKGRARWGRALMASSMSRRGARDRRKRWSSRKGAEWELKPVRGQPLR